MRREFRTLAEYDEQFIVTQCLSGDRDAFAAVYAAHGRKVLAYFRRSGLRPSDADDLCQEVFTRAFRSLKTFDPSRGALGAWIAAIARNVARRHWRKAARQGGSFDPELAEQTLADDNPGDDAESAESIEALDDCVGRLPEEMARLIELRYIDARTTRGMAEVLDIPEATVRLRLDKARDLLRRCLEEKGIDQ